MTEPASCDGKAGRGVPAFDELLALLGGAALGAAHNSTPWAGPAALPLPALCGMLGIWGVIRSLRRASPPRGALRGALGLAGAAALGLTWVTEVSVPGYIGLIAWLAAGGAAFGFAVPAASRAVPRAAFPALVAAAWAGMELCRSALFTGFPWLLSGALWAGLPAAMSPAELGGPFLMAFLTALVPALAVGPPERPSRRAAAAAAVLLVWLTAGGLRARTVRLDSEGGRKLRVAAVQPRVPFKVGPKADRVEMLREQRRLTSGLEQGGADLVVWSETMVPGELLGEAGQVLAAVAVEKRCWVLAGGVIRDDRGHKYNSAALVSPLGEAAGHYDKRHLVPFGEYVPLGGRFPGADHVFRLIGTIFTPGVEHPLPSMGPDLRLGVSICYEDCFPAIARRDALRSADLLVNLTNDSWFRRSPEAGQHLALAAFRAVETRRPLVRSTNTGVSALVASDGSIAVPENGGLWEKGLVRMEARLPAKRPGNPLYMRLGDAPAWICSALVAVAALVGTLWPGVKRNQPGCPG